LRLCSQELNPLIFPIIVANCAGWLGYGMTLGDAFLFVPNAMGLLLGVFYTLSIIAFADQQARRLCDYACGLNWPAK